MKQLLKLTSKESWAEQNRKLKEKLNIQCEDMLSSKYQLRKTLQNKARIQMEERLKKTAESKSKMQYYMDGKTNRTVGQRAKYLSKLTRNQASIIFKTRTRMLKVKGNYKNGHKDLQCRLCGKAEETQTHILEECSKLIIVTPIITKEMIFQEEAMQLLKTANMIELRMNELEEIDTLSTCLPLANTSDIRECAH